MKTESISWLNYLSVIKGLFAKPVMLYIHGNYKLTTPVNHESYWKYSI